MLDHQLRPVELRGSLPRRRFLGGLTAAAAAAWIGLERPGGAGETAPAELPTIPLGKYRISRLIAGSNPILGYSYLGHHTDQHMREYFTPARTVEFLRQCEQAGINAHQFSTVDKRAEDLRALRAGGSKMLCICLHAQQEKIKSAIELTQPIAMVHHGGVTDRLYAEGKFSKVRDYVKAVHDCGLLAGVSAHNPACIQRIADEGWEVDFFMTCFYFVTRKPAPGEPPSPSLDLVYPFYKDDPHRMTEVVRKVKQPCLAFKILGAGRKCANQQMVRQAFQYAFSRVKPTDGVIVGMYPRFFDEVSANAGYARELGRLPPTGA